MSLPQVTILIPHYKTLELTQLCLRLLRIHTDPTLAKVIVIDNGSQDASSDYLRSLKWITFIERSPVPDEPPTLAHSRALDLGLKQTNTPYVLSIHTDTLIRKNAWLAFLLTQINQHPLIAGVGSWKLENKSFLKKCLKFPEKIYQKIYPNKIYQAHYLRSHCALYRRDLLDKYQLTFSDNHETAGKAMHRALVEHGYQMVFLTSKQLLPYMDHINHATTVLNPELSRHKKSVTKGLARIKKSLDSFDAKHILENTSLDN